jgi:very-short-patch-repair endonuclease
MTLHAVRTHIFSLAWGSSLVKRNTKIAASPPIPSNYVVTLGTAWPSYKRRFRKRRHRLNLTTQEFAAFLRAKSTPQEKLLWAALQQRRCEGVEFLYQEPVLGWIADFLAPSLKLIVEVDGRGHQYGRQKQHDMVRDHILATQGWTTLRITNDEVIFELSLVVNRIKKVVNQLREG